MSDLLLELYCEEIPASMQSNAAEALKRQVINAVTAEGLEHQAARALSTPRRLVLDIRGLSKKSRAAHELRKGPAVTAPKAAIEGFLRANGLNSVNQAKIMRDSKKREYYAVEITRKGRLAEEILADILPKIIRGFSWPKSMRWGARSAHANSMRWVRPLHSVLCLLSTETESAVVPFQLDGIKSGNITFGHPFLYGRTPIKVRNFDDYAARLDKAYVILDTERRKEIILADARNLCFARGLQMVEDDALAQEVAGLVEWPVVLLGAFDMRFLQIPAEIIRLTIKTNQKCFVTRPMRSPSPTDNKAAKSARSETGLANYFVLTSNIVTHDSGAAIIAGNSRVVQARLADALYFWQTDQKALPDVSDLQRSAAKFSLDLSKPLDQRMARLDNLNVTFHAKLGTQGARVARIAALAAKIASLVHADKKAARRAAVLAKADLQTEIVGEFPELQGIIGHKYALLQGEPAEIAAAVEEHYKPQGPKDSVPRNNTAIAVALADKIDSLVGFWLIGEKPTGSKDPYALRRAALGVIRLVLSQEWQIQLLPLFREAAQLLHIDIAREHIRHFARANRQNNKAHNSAHSSEEEEKRFDEHFMANADSVLQDLLSFFHDRFKIWLREEGAPYDIVNAVLTPKADNLLQAARKAEALTHFIGSDKGGALLSGAKRALNILAAAEDKKTVLNAQVDPVAFTQNEETALYQATFQAEKQLEPLLAKNDFKSALAVLANLREPIDAFFDAVRVNDDDNTLRANRLAILARIRSVIGYYADFSKLNG